MRTQTDGCSIHELLRWRYAVLPVSHPYLAEENLIWVAEPGLHTSPSSTPGCLAAQNQPLKGAAESGSTPSPLPAPTIFLFGESA